MSNKNNYSEIELIITDQFNLLPRSGIQNINMYIISICAFKIYINIYNVYYFEEKTSSGY